MTIEGNMDKILRWLYEKDKEDPEKWYNGPILQENLRLRAQDMNDAVDVLWENDLITRINWMGTSPYRFGQIRINPHGKYEIEKQKSVGEEIIRDAKKKLLFFSYSVKDKGKVGEICDILVKDHNFDVFRAHDTIKVTHEWRARIKESLNKCDGLVAYVTRKFRGSEWTFQECGWVACRGVPIYSLFIMKKIPRGFIEELQGSRISHKTDPKEIAQKISDAFP